MTEDNDSIAEGEKTRKWEAIEALAVEICEGPVENVSSVFRTALEKGWQKELQLALRSYEKKKQAEISRICNRHYSTFIESAEELLHMKSDLKDLSTQISGLNSEVQLTGRGALTAAKTILQQNHASYNVSATLKIILKCNEIVSTVMDAFVHIQEEKYYTALNTLDAIQKSLNSLGNVKFATQLKGWMPSMTEMIEEATKEEMGQWLLDIRDASCQIGASAMRRYAGICQTGKNIESSFDQNRNSSLITTHSIQCLNQFEDLLGCSLKLEESELAEFLPGFMIPKDKALQAEEDRTLDDGLSNFLHPVHRALHIFARLDMLDDFRAWYIDLRKPMADMRSMVTRDLDHLDTEGFLTYLPTLVNGMVGFFIVEDSLIRKVDHKEGLMTIQEVEAAWRMSLNSLRELIEYHMGGLSRPGHFMQLKESLLAMSKLSSDLELNYKPLIDLLRKLIDPYRKLLLLAFEGECRRIMQEESFQPLEILSEEEYNTFIVPLGLHKSLESQNPNDSLSYLTNHGSTRNVRKRFPLTCPFSATVPEIGFSLLKLCALMVAFLTHIDFRNGNRIIFDVLDSSTAVIKQILLEMLHGAESDSHILKAAQISTNSIYMSHLPTNLAELICECMTNLQFTESSISDYDSGGGSSSYDKESCMESLRKKCKELEHIFDRSRDLIFELVREKADLLLAGMEFIKWEPPSVNKGPNPYCEDLINYLRVTFMNLSSLPTDMREAAHFTCMTHVCNSIMREMLSRKSCPSINILGILNLSKDIDALIYFCEESGIPQLSQCFNKLSQILDIILKNDHEVILDPLRRSTEYPSLDIYDLVEVFEKYRNLSLASRIKNTVGDEVPQLEHKVVKQFLARLKEQLH